MGNHRIENIRIKNNPKTSKIHNKLIRIIKYKLWFSNKTKTWCADFDWRIPRIITSSDRVRDKFRRKAFIRREQCIRKLRLTYSDD